MRTRIGFSGRVAGGLIAGCLIAGGSAAAADAPAGERWRQTQSMEMMGMTMPARTTEFCKEAGSGDLPVKPDKNCTMHDVKRTAKGATFRMTCTGEHAAEAEGETVFLGPDHMRTKMHMKMAEGEMTMNLESQKLGPCTGNESNLVAKREVAKAEKAQAEAQQQLAKSCADAARDARSPAMITQICKDPATVRSYCANFQRHEPFRVQAEEEARTRRSGVAVPAGTEANMLPLTTTVRLCGIDPDKLRERLCGTAEAQGQMAFIATQCVGLARAIAARECAGRSYTSIPARYQAICASLATPAAAAGAAAGGAPAQASRVCIDAARTAESPDLMTKECKDPATVATYCANFQTLAAFRSQAEKEAQQIKAGTPANERTRPLTTSANLCGLDVAKVRAQLCTQAREQGDAAFVASQCAEVAAEGKEKKPNALSKGKKILGGLLGN